MIKKAGRRNGVGWGDQELSFGYVKFEIPIHT